MTSYLSTQEDVGNLLNLPDMRDQNGVMFSYITDPQILAKLVPAPLKVAAPIIAGYVDHIENPSYSKPYDEAVLYAMVNYGKIVGAYPFSLFLAGPGAEEAMIAGREGASMPKKLADKITIDHNDQSIHAEVIRHGVKLIDLDWSAGMPNDPETAKKIMAAIGGEIGKPSETASFFINYALKQNDDGSNDFVNTELVATQSTGVYSKLVPGSVSLKLESSTDDPVAELAVVKPVAGAWYQMDYSKMHKTLHLTQLDAKQVAPYLITGNYDRAFLAH